MHHLPAAIPLRRGFPGALLALLVAGPFVSRGAEAGCTHLTLGFGNPAGDSVHLELLSHYGALAPAPAAPRAPEPHHQPGSCPGGSCSSAPSVPLLPSTAEGLQVSRWAAYLLAFPAIPIRSMAPVKDEPSPHPTDRAFPIFHPPRAA